MRVFSKPSNDLPRVPTRLTSRDGGDPSSLPGHRVAYRRGRVGGRRVF